MDRGYKNTSHFLKVIFSTTLRKEVQAGTGKCCNTTLRKEMKASACK